MSKKITHEQVRAIVNNQSYGPNTMKAPDRIKLFDYTSQQEKQEKLLELYKILSDKLLYLLNNDCIETEATVYILQQQIKELENE